ncbi:MAG TPA: aminotransferase class I/II-fold pyridoxal phosphate-dependent enzyme [Caulobacteraceae bacterium]|nr:aminotransferase class I/II-fold pyridoxal phosphate-dependent enzyme [Caulobacteraceae bacterium]
MRAQLPAAGEPWPALRERMAAMGEGDVDWRHGKTAVYVFNAGEDVEQVQREAYALYMAENGLGPAAFPSLKGMEEAVIGYGLSLLHAPEEATGSITSGGTDSITMAMKAARDVARRKGRPGRLNVVLPRSAHLAFDKAAALMEVEVRRTPLKDFLADVQAMDAAADDDTIMIVGSAPCFPYGLMDPIAELGALAQARGLWLHVDACVGGYAAPFVRMNGADIAPFDFEVAGVSSMSADLHKYGFCAKGASTVLFRSAELWKAMVFDFRDWPGGRMVTPTLAGTRPGGAIAAAYAVMTYLGVEGYRERHGQVVAAREIIEAGVRERGYAVHGRPQLGLVSFSGMASAPALWMKMRERGWFTSTTSEPPGLHLMLSPVHREVAHTYLEDLDWAASQVGPDAAAAPRYGG